VRGGAWNNNRNNARCAYRNRNDPGNFNNNLGFRLVLSHIFNLAGSAVRLRAAVEAKWPVLSSFWNSKNGLAI